MTPPPDAGQPQNALDAARLQQAKAEYDATVDAWQEIQRYRHFTQHTAKEAVVEPAVTYIRELESALAAALTRAQEAEISIKLIREECEHTLKDEYRTLTLGVKGICEAMLDYIDPETVQDFLADEAVAASRPPASDGGV